MADRKIGVKSQKNFKGKRGNYRNSYWNHKNQSPATAAYAAMISKHYIKEDGGERNTDRMLRVENALLHDAFAHVFKRNMLCDPAVRRENLQVIHEIICDYRRSNILYVSSEKVPEGAIPFPTEPHLYLIEERYGMPFQDFLLYLKGDDEFTSDQEKFSALSDWTGIPIEKMEDIDLAVIAPFFRKEAIIRNIAREEEEWGFCHSHPFTVWSIHARTVNINR